MARPLNTPENLAAGLMAVLELIRFSDGCHRLTGTYGSEMSFVVVKPLRFYTKLAEYGPFGSETGTPFSFRRKGGMITGFHGRTDGYVDFIGFYLKPLCPDCVPIINKSQSPLIFGYLGFWGGDDGREFDDGVYRDVKGVEVYSFNNAISSIQFKYVKRNGTASNWSPKYGGGEGAVMKKVEINSGEHLVGIERFYGPIDGITGDTAVGKYGPLGTAIGKFFTSYECKKKKKIVGSLGKSGAYLNAIGVHSEYL
ncbi:hypothetical protein CDL12_14290 [Handroanthus impetiginosus]|uniref:Jacalin-type lectin domain-containing protein n=1 Tax=Handroanthus impetiginosus TaxID=429701 RepID=A0A2G9H6I3_9LAMI|nr:hypothetical protein CDL12_14290 [Handroanthus impetiginosus]